MHQWFVYQGAGSHVGPVTTDLLVRGIASGRVPKDAHVAMAGSTQWKPLMTIDEIASALDALDDTDASLGSIGLAPIAPAAAPPPEAPPSEAAPTEVLRRDEMRKAGLAAGKPRMPSVPPQPQRASSSFAAASPSPPKPPMRSTNPPPLRPSGSMAAIAPSKSAIPSVPPVAPPPVAPPPPNTLRTFQGEPAPAPPVLAPQAPQASQPPPPPLPPAPQVPVAAFAPLSVPPPKDEPNRPLVDPRTALLLPLGIFGAFVFLSLIVVLVALVTKPRTPAAESGADPAPAITRP